MNLVHTISNLSPDDLALVVAFIDGAARHISRHATVPEQAAELIRWAESSGGPGLETVQKALEQLSPGRRLKNLVMSLGTVALGTVPILVIIVFIGWKEFSRPPGIVIEDVNIRRSYQRYYYKFQISNPYGELCVIDRVGLTILEVMPHPVTNQEVEPGAPISTVKLPAIVLTPVSSHILLLDRGLHAFSKGDIENFEVKITAVDGYIYTCRTEIYWHIPGDSRQQLSTGRSFRLGWEGLEKPPKVHSKFRDSNYVDPPVFVD
jgi:hypothetical protein